MKVVGRVGEENEYLIKEFWGKSKEISHFDVVIAASAALEDMPAVDRRIYGGW